MKDVTAGMLVAATLQAKEKLEERFGVPADLDLIEALAFALASEDEKMMQLVFTVGCQRETRAREEKREA